MTKYLYRATSHGTLNDPYRFIEKGSIVSSDVPLDVSWLEEHDPVRGRPLPVPPPTTALNISGAQVQRVKHAPAPVSDAYKKQMDKVREIEGQEDAKARKGKSRNTAAAAASEKQEPEQGQEQTNPAATDAGGDGAGSSETGGNTEDEGGKGTGNQDVI